MRCDDIIDRAFRNMAAGQPHGLLDGEVQDLVRQLRNYQELAMWLADVTAATAETLLDRKATSVSERGRQATIVLHALSDLKHEVCTQRSRDREAVVDRLQRIVDTSGRGGQKPLRAGHSHSADMRCCDPCPAYGR